MARDALLDKNADEGVLAGDLGVLRTGNEAFSAAVREVQSERYGEVA